MNKKDSLGDRIKKYECTYKSVLLDNMYTIIRLDGKAFHTYTKGLKKPFDKGLVDDMISTTEYLCEIIQGVKIGYVQSDEITLVLTDFDTYTTQAWFDNEIQKIVSISASYATQKFNQLRTKRAMNNNRSYTEADFLNWFDTIRPAHFDSRVFQVPTLGEVFNCLLWRQQDCVRNSISSSAQCIYSSKQLHGVNTKGMQELIFQKGEQFKEKLTACGYQIDNKENFNWNDLTGHLKRGMSIYKKQTHKFYGKEAYEKAKDKDDWSWSAYGLNGETSEAGFHYKKVMQWTQEPLNYSDIKSITEQNYYIPLNK